MKTSSESVVTHRSMLVHSELLSWTPWLKRVLDMESEPGVNDALLLDDLTTLETEIRSEISQMPVEPAEAFEAIALICLHKARILKLRMAVAANGCTDSSTSC